MPKMNSLACKNCGARLSISSSAQFITCTYCGTDLEVQRDEAEFSTQILSKLTDETTRLRYERTLARLDREWETQRKKFVSREQNGEELEPTIAGSIVASVIATVFGIGWFILVSGLISSESSHDFGFAKVGFTKVFPYFGLLMALLGIIAGITGFNRTKQYQSLRNAYEKQRAILIHKLEEGLGSSSSGAGERLPQI